jgi:hypothetical protein
MSYGEGWLDNVSKTNAAFIFFTLKRETALVLQMSGSQASVLCEHWKNIIRKSKHG